MDHIRMHSRAAKPLPHKHCPKVFASCGQWQHPAASHVPVALWPLVAAVGARMACSGRASRAAAWRGPVGLLFVAAVLPPGLHGVLVVVTLHDEASVRQRWVPHRPAPFSQCKFNGVIRREGIAETRREEDSKVRGGDGASGQNVLICNGDRCGCLALNWGKKVANYSYINFMVLMSVSH
jgi:hypothetical protein